MNRFQSEDEIEKVVRGFEACQTDADNFRHPRSPRSGRLVCAHDGSRFGTRSHALRLVALSRSSWGGQREVQRNCTVFWIDKIAAKLNELGPNVSLVEKCNTVLGRDFAMKADERGSGS